MFLTGNVVGTFGFIILLSLLYKCLYIHTFSFRSWLEWQFTRIVNKWECRQDYIHLLFDEWSLFFFPLFEKFSGSVFQRVQIGFIVNAILETFLVFIGKFYINNHSHKLLFLTGNVVGTFGFIILLSLLYKCLYIHTFSFRSWLEWQFTRIVNKWECRHDYIHLLFIRPHNIIHFIWFELRFSF